MAESSTNSGPRGLAFAMAAVAVLTLMIAAVDTPVGDWSGGNYLFGALLLVFAVVFTVSGLRGSFNLTGRLSPKGSVILGALGAAASLLVIVGGVIAGDWNVSSILTTGIWVALFLMFIGTIVVGRSKMSAGQ